MLVLEGEKALLRCIVKGTPKPTVKWYKSRRKIATDSNHEITVRSCV